jgi:hypothetical protein
MLSQLLRETGGGDDCEVLYIGGEVVFLPELMDSTRTRLLQDEAQVLNNRFGDNDDTLKHTSKFFAGFIRQSKAEPVRRLNKRRFDKK